MTAPNLTAGEKLYLSRRECALCGQRLDKLQCGAAYGPGCTRALLIERRDACLARYRVRHGSSKQAQP